MIGVRLLIMAATPLWTSTQFHNWKGDCAKCTAAHQAFEVRDVHNPEQEKFCFSHCQLHNYKCVLTKLVASCSPAV